MVRVVPTANHWGIGHAEVDGTRLVAILDHGSDPRPSAISQGLVDAVYSAARVQKPAVRKGFLRRGAQSDRRERGREPFVGVPWDEALDIAARELDRIRRTYGNEAIFAGSYGWASAGRFHHAQSQIHRFMNCIGGYTRSVDNYSFAAAMVLLPHVVGPIRELQRRHTTWPVVAKHGELVVMFGGIPLSNTQVSGGGVSRHVAHDLLKGCQCSGVAFVNISPVRSDAATELEADWLALRPNTDTAVMLGLAHTLVTEDLHDREFLDKYTVGFDHFLAYLLGHVDGQAKNAGWAAAISGLEAEAIRHLARRMAAKRTLVCAAISLQRADHGEQPMWMTIVLAAMLGQIGLPGGGFGIGYGQDGVVGIPSSDFTWPSLPQGERPIDCFIPVSRFADMLLNPGQTFDYDGRSLRYPEIKLVYWAGGNPFHHHQNINRLIRAFRRPETIIVNEIWWTATARHADIVLPTTTTLERNDICMTRAERVIAAMHKAIEPVGEARDDYAIFSGLAERMGVTESFTLGRDETAWLADIWGRARSVAAQQDLLLPEFHEFWEQEIVELPSPPSDRVLLREFRDDPNANPLPTPSGRIEIFSQTIHDFGYADCPGHPMWFEPYEWLGSSLTRDFPLHLLSGQPSVRLHSQLDDGASSRAKKVAGREPVTMHPKDAAERGITSGDVVRIFNRRGACLTGVQLSDALRPGVVQLATGAWYDPDNPGRVGALDKHGNPNVLTRDKGTSRLAQGPTPHSTLVEIERVEEVPPPVTAHFPPPIEERAAANCSRLAGMRKYNSSPGAHRESRKTRTLSRGSE